MSTELCYFEKPFELQFTANVVSKKTLEDGRVCLVLDRTYFYPTGGGQEHDTGSVGQARVLDVFKDDQGNVIHVLDQDIEDEIVTARIDGERRFGHMQHHSAQHILTQCFQRVLDLETISVKISVDSPSAIDLYASDINPLDLTRVEELANSIIYQNRPIKSYFITEEDAHKVPFRRPPVITEQIRVIEVDGFDYSACGGTHCTATGMVGIIKVLKTDRRAEKLRV
ncbi:MAG: alanyl-tRNA editing protein, partial [Sphaerochaetaceae bacterium]|nr:alanyl-tRNA editing protein [Sphaerochaetaceae bacterium]